MSKVPFFAFLLCIMHEVSGFHEKKGCVTLAESGAVPEEAGSAPEVDAGCRAHHACICEGFSPPDLALLAGARADAMRRGEPRGGAAEAGPGHPGGAPAVRLAAGTDHPSVAAAALPMAGHGNHYILAAPTWQGRAKAVPARLNIARF